MKKIFINHPAGDNGGPAVFVKKLSQGLRSYSIQLDFSDKRNLDAALLMIRSNGLISHFKQRNIQVAGRTSGFYIPPYWHSKTADRMMTGDKIAHNKSLAVDLKQYDHMIYQSQWSKDMCDQYLTPRFNDFSIIHNGVDLNHFKPIEKQSERIRLLVLGNLRHAYTAVIPIFIYQQLKNDFDLELQFVGKIDTACQQILNQHKSDLTISYKGPTNHSQLPPIFQQADILIHPRQGDTCPNVVSEALACGIPVVTAEWGGAHELLGKGGVTVTESVNWEYSEEYKENFVAQTCKVLENLNQYKEEARSQAETNLSLDKMVKGYLKALKLD